MYANINVVFFLQKNKVSLLRPVTVKTAFKTTFANRRSRGWSF